MEIQPFDDSAWCVEWYDFFMSSKLSTVNPYLRDPESRRRSVLRSVATSSAIEGIRAPFKQAMRKAAKPAVSAGKNRIIHAKP
ncbi:MAG: hypothetical protein ACRES7_02750 [Gammaproteobacteria bacterium]